MVDLFRPGESLAWDYLGLSTLFLAAGGLVSLAWSGRPARAHRVLVLAILAALLTPPLAGAVHYRGWGLCARARTTERVAVADGPTTSPAFSDSRSRPSLAPLSSEDSVEPPVPARKSSPPGSVATNWPELAVLAWAALSGLATIRLLISLVLDLRVMARSRDLDDSTILAALGSARERIGIDVEPRVIVSDEVRCPMIWCWGRRPTLLLPSTARADLAGVDWVGVMSHELAHLRRRDHWSGLVGEVLACALPWNPLSWWTRARLGHLSELAADDWVLASGLSASDYAESLLGFLPNRRPGLALAAVSSRVGLFDRLRHILDDRRHVPAAGRLWSALAVAATVVLVAVTALAQARPEQGPEAAALATERTLKGVVLGPEGKAAQGARLVWIGIPRPKLGFVARPIGMRDDPTLGHKILGKGPTDAAGGFTLSATYDPDEMYGTILIARAPGLGPASQAIDGPNAPAPGDLSLTLPATVPIEGRLLAPSGGPAAGVEVSLGSLGSGSTNSLSRGAFQGPDDLAEFWPAPIKTDAEGRFRIEGFVPAGTFAGLSFHHPDFADDEVTVSTGGTISPIMRAFDLKPVERTFTHTLEPARPVEGTVTAADTQEPLANVVIEMIPMRSHGGMPFHTKTDERGHYRVSGHKGNSYITQAVAPADSGYLSLVDSRHDWPEGAKSLVVDFKLPRGKVIRGRVVKEGGKPVHGASVAYQPNWGNPNAKGGLDLRNPVLTDAEGRFTLAGLPGPGFLVVDVPDPAFLRQRLSIGEQGAWYPHGFARIDVPADGDLGPREIAVREGKMIEVRALDPDGKALPSVFAWYDQMNYSQLNNWSASRPFPDGLVRIYGADPERTYRVFLIDPKGKRGAVAEVKFDAGRAGPVDVRLQPMARLKGRVVEPDGRPGKGMQVTPMIVLDESVGPIGEDRRFFGGGGGPVDFYVNLMSETGVYTQFDIRSGDDGAFVWDLLIPGARFDAQASRPGASARREVAPLAPGEERDLGTITLKPNKDH